MAAQEVNCLSIRMETAGLKPEVERLYTLRLFLCSLCSHPDKSNHLGRVICVRWAIGPRQARSLEQAGFLCRHRGLGAVLGIQFAAQGAHMQLDGDFLQIQIAGDFLVGLALAQAT